MKVLIYCPLAPITPKIYARTVQSIFKMDWTEPVDVVFGREDIVPPTQTAYDNICAKYEHARALALAGGYDALFTVESDMILPPLALERLSRIDADVAYGLYVSRHGRHKWLAFHHVSEFSGTSYSDTPDVARAAWGSVVETKGVGLGCTLIHRRVLENVPFRWVNGTTANDWYFAIDLSRGGYVQKHDLGVVCGHIDKDLSRIYWPDPTQDKLFRHESIAEVERPAPPSGQFSIPLAPSYVELKKPATVTATATATATVEGTWPTAPSPN